MGAGGDGHLFLSCPPPCGEPGIPSSEISSFLTFYQSLLLGRVAGGIITAYVVSGLLEGNVGLSPQMEQRAELGESGGRRKPCTFETPQEISLLLALLGAYPSLCWEG